MLYKKHGVGWPPKTMRNSSIVTRSNRRLRMTKISRLTTARLVLRHWCLASRIQGCGMVLNSTGRNRFATTGRVRIVFGWSWTFQIARVTLHEGEVAPLTSQKLARVMFFAVCLTGFPFEFWPRTFTIELYGKKIYPIRAYDFGVQFSFNFLMYNLAQCQQVLHHLSLFACFFLFFFFGQNHLDGAYLFPG